MAPLIRTLSKLDPRRLSDAAKINSSTSNGRAVKPITEEQNLIHARRISFSQQEECRQVSEENVAEETDKETVLLKLKGMSILLTQWQDKCPDRTVKESLEALRLKIKHHQNTLPEEIEVIEQIYLDLQQEVQLLFQRLSRI
jgi:hypothetical protein